jgi:hypothetical protein
MTTRAGTTWRLFATTTVDVMNGRRYPTLCTLLMRGAVDEGTDCSAGYTDSAEQPVFVTAIPSDLFFSETDVRGASLVIGIAADAAASVQLTLTSGRRVRVSLSTDHGFAYFCGRTGCACAVQRIDALADDGHVQASETALSRYWCPKRRP